MTTSKDLNLIMLPSIEDFAKEKVNEMDDYKLMDVWNEYTVEGINDPDSQVFVNDEEFLSLFENGDSSMLIRRALCGEYSLANEYVTLNGYGNFVSSDFIKNLISEDDLIDYLAEQDEVIDEYTTKVEDHLVSTNIACSLRSLDNFLKVNKQDHEAIEIIRDTINDNLDTICNQSTVDQIKAAIDLNEKMNFEIDDDLLHEELEIKEYRETHQTTTSELTPTPDVPATKTEDLSL